MRVLVACEYSGTVRDAFTAMGHDATSCDLLPTEKKGNHYQGDVFDIIEDGWDMIIAHPPCTYIANSSVVWLDKEKGRRKKMADGAMFFRRILDVKCDLMAIENPIPHKHAMKIIKTRYSQIIQPWQFGHPESKSTCLWLKGLPHLVPTNTVKHVMNSLPVNERNRIHYMPPGPDRWKERSRTYDGIAKAMASQWGKMFYSQGGLFDGK